MGSIDLKTEKGEIHVRKVAQELTRSEVSHAIVLLLEAVLNESPVEIDHTPAGKPYIKGKESLHLSVSHAAGWIAVYVSGKRPVGIDIEPEQGKIRKIESYFINEAEKLSFGSLSISALQLIWSAKEAIYKYYDGKFEALEKEVTVQQIHDETIVADTIYGQAVCFYRVLEGDVYLVWI